MVNYWNNLSGTADDFHYSRMQLHSGTFSPFHTCHGNGRRDGTRDNPEVGGNATLVDANRNVEIQVHHQQSLVIGLPTPHESFFHQTDATHYVRNGEPPASRPHTACRAI